MISIRVTSFNGQALTTPLAGSFAEAGGTIGRGESNHLVLVDPDRYVSRLQARVDYRNGEWRLTNQGANPINLNGDRINNGEWRTLKPGDSIRIGPYSLQVDMGPPAAGTAGEDLLAGLGEGSEPMGLFAERASVPADPFAGLEGDASELKPFASLDVQPGALQPPARTGAGAAPADPFARVDVQHAPGFSGAGSSGVANSRTESTPPGGAHIIPTDFDPFADLLPGRAAPTPPSIPADLGLLGQPSPTEGSIDALFGLNEAKRSGADPLAGTPLSAAPATDAEGRALDPLLALSGRKPPPAAPASAPDHGAEIHGSFEPPQAKPVGKAPLPGWAGEPQPQERPQAMMDSHVFVSWEDKGASGGVVKSTVDPLIPPPRPTQKPPVSEALRGGAIPGGSVQPVRAPGTSPVRDAAGSSGSGATAPMTPSPSAPAAASAGRGDPGLAAALLAGLGLGTMELRDGVTPELMARLGRLLREATQGTLDLLLARAMMKREVRAEMTVISPRRNNPLKFSPDVAVALAHLVAPQAPGFMSPEESIRDAYEDLRSHEIGFMAGMRAALAGVLKRFDPEVLEGKLRDKSMMDALLPMNRRARLWDLYTELYRDIAAEAADDFNALFGREFVRAYEEQVARLDQERKP